MPPRPISRSTTNSPTVDARKRANIWVHGEVGVAGLVAGADVEAPSADPEGIVAAPLTMDGDTLTGVPHRPQNRSAGTSVLPHCAQLGGAAVPGERSVTESWKDVT